MALPASAQKQHPSPAMQEKGKLQIETLCRSYKIRSSGISGLTDTLPRH